MVDPNNPIVEDINTIVNFLSIGVGVVVITFIIVGGIQYATAGDSPEGLSKAKSRITNALIALLAFIFLWAFIQWLVPGGVFGGSGSPSSPSTGPPATPPTGPPRIGPPTPI